MKDFLTFIRTQGIVGLAIGFILGGAASSLVTSFVSDILNPVVGIFVGDAGESLASATFVVNGVTIGWGSFVASMIDFTIIAGIVYYIVLKLRLDSLDEAKTKA